MPVEGLLGPASLKENPACSSGQEGGLGFQEQLQASFPTRTHDKHQSQQTGAGLEKATEVYEDPEGSENDHFSKGMLLASQAHGWRAARGGGKGEVVFSLTQPGAVNFSLEQNEQRVFSAVLQ